MKFGALTILVLSLVSCGIPVNVPDDVKRVIEKTSVNKDELYAVIKHYSYHPEDSLKLKAAYFLILNLDGLKTLDTTSIFNKDLYFNEFNITISRQKKKLLTYLAVKIVDSINKVSLEGLDNDAVYVNELDIVSSDFLIKNIDQAFYVWENMPWSKHIKFSDFCEYILPYRSSDTYSEDSRKLFFERYKNLADSVGGSKNPFIPASYILKDIKTWFTEFPDFFRNYSYLQPIKFSNLLKGKVGDCSDATALRISALRSLGVPVAFDHLPNWGNNRQKHFWYKIIDQENDTIKTLLANVNRPSKTEHIIPSSSFSLKNHVNDGVPGNVIIEYLRTVPKVFRSCFSKQHSSLAFLKPNLYDIPEYFKSDRLKDVTKDYVRCSDVVIKLDYNIKNENLVYLSVFNIDDWNPVSWSRAEGNSVKFENMGRNIVYLPICYVDGELTPVGNPFLLSNEGNQIEIKSKPKKEKVQLFMKFPYRMMIHERQSGMIGGKFQFANKSDLSDTITVHKIDKTPFYKTTVELKNQKPYRYLLYNFKDATESWLGELEFSSVDKAGKELKLTGKLIGNPGHDSFSAENIRDKNQLTYFTKNETGDHYIGIDLGKDNVNPITGITFIPRNDGNGIVEYMKYELFYWHNEWISLGFSTGSKKKTVNFENVPKNSLLLLKDCEGGTENRIFTYSSGKQFFW